MTDKTPDDDTKTPPTPPTTPDPPPAPEGPPAVTPAPPASKGGRGLAWLALLVALGAGGGSGYLWYQGQQDQQARIIEAMQREQTVQQAIQQTIQQSLQQALAQRDLEVQALKLQIQELQALKPTLDQVRDAGQDLRSQMLGLTGDLQPLKNAMELQKGETTVLKGEIQLLRERYDTRQTAVQEQHEELDAQVRDQQDRIARMDERLQNLRLGHNTLQEDLETFKVVAIQGGDANAFPLAEVDYLLRLADTKLRLERNVATAHLALDTARQRLRAVDERIMDPVDTLLGEAIASLRGVRLPDVPGRARKLTALTADVDTLPVQLTAVPDIRNRFKPGEPTVTDPDQSWWEQTTDAVWNQFKDIVVIRREGITAPPLIAVEEEFFLRQNLRLELDGMRLALLRGDAEAYQHAYEQIRDWTQKYFDTQDERVARFLDELQALHTVQFNPYIPDLTGLNQAFHDALNRRQPIRPVRTAPAALSTESAAADEETQP
jgi:uncharacterized protein HemX